MMVPEWSRLPIWWIVSEHRLCMLNGRECGVGIAALKIYIVLVNSACNSANDDKFGKAATSFTQFERQTAMSRSMVANGIKKLQEMNIIEIEKIQGRTNLYSLVGYSKVPYLKLPKRYLAGYNPMAKPLLKLIPLRGKANLNALKLYLYLAACIDRKYGWALQTYNTIEHKTGIRRNDIRKAISMLINFDMIYLTQEEADFTRNMSSQRPPNYYFIQGLPRKRRP